MLPLITRKGFATDREMVWVEKELFRGWACSDCAWKFNPLRFPAGKTITERDQNYERQRDGEFKWHVCAKHQIQRTNSFGLPDVKRK
jgi:hypothetical protein